MQANPFESQLERLARTLTEQFGVLVTCQGENAWTDGRQIVLPSVPEPMDESLERMMLGYLDHEMAHVAFSDFKVVRHFVEKPPGHASSDDYTAPARNWRRETGNCEPVLRVPASLWSNPPNINQTNLAPPPRKWCIVGWQSLFDKSPPATPNPAVPRCS